MNIKTLIVTNLISKFGNVIKEKVGKAVLMVEQQFIGIKGEEKKQFAINYIMNSISLPFYLKPFKGVIKKLLNEFITNAIEDALKILNRKINEKLN